MWGRYIIEVKYSSYDLNPKFIGCHEKVDIEEDQNLSSGLSHGYRVGVKSGQPRGGMSVWKPRGQNFI